MMNIALGGNKFSSIAHVIFDKDGTITDSHVYWGEIIRRRAIRLCEIYGSSLVTESEIELAMGYDRSISRLIAEGPIAIKNRDEVISALHLFLVGKKVAIEPSTIAQVFDEVHVSFASESLDFIVPIAGVRDLILHLHTSGIRLSLITSDTEEGARNTLRKMELSTVFDFVAGKDSGLGHKVSGLPAVAACNCVDVDVENTLVIGDAPMDFIMADNAGIKNVILVATGQIPIDQLSKTSTSCASIQELRVSPL